MISASDIYNVVTAVLPLYVTMILAYVSVKYWKMFTSDQCSGINKFVAKFSIPLLSFQVISANNPYKLNAKLVLSDFVQKLLALLSLAVIAKLSRKARLSWIIMGMSVLTLPNTLILGVPLLTAMYGDKAAGLLAQIVVLQSLVWYNLFLFLYEVNSARTIPTSLPAEPIAEGEAEGNQGDEQKDDGEAEVTRRERKGKVVIAILMTVGKKLIANPNTHATLAGLVWACISFRWSVKLPAIVAKSISILADGGLGMAMFSIGLFMSSQARIVACGTRMAILTMTMKFLVGPAMMAASSMAVGLSGKTLKVAIVQAALPQGIVPFVFAKEYNVHPEILSTGVILGMLIATPITLAYYLLFAL